MGRTRKALISAFIVVSVLTQVFQNLSVGYVPYPAERGPLYAAVGAIDQGRWLLETFGFYTGTNGYWRMFSPVHRYDWSWRVIATDPDGRDRDLSSPSYTGHTGPEAFFVDFRETKMLLNLWTRPPMQSAYIDHRCREEQRAGRAPVFVRLEMSWRAIVPPDEAAARSDHRHPNWYSTVMARGPCTRRP